MAKKKQEERNIADLINSGEIKNLADINWRKETHSWRNEIAKEIIENINDNTLKPAIIDVMLSEWRFNRDELVTGLGFDMNFCDFLEGLKRHIQNYGRFNIETIKSHQTKELNQIKKDIERLKKEVFTLPKELDTVKTKNLFKKAIAAGVCDDTYKWLKSKALLAYFADKVSEYLNLGKGEYDGKTKTSWKPFETLFSISGLSGAKRDYQKTGTLPDGYSDVDKLFE
ncbi:MAG: hypothetical protein PHC95_11225 [Parabacteroides sp.]|nr:hypothetical protein [Parabacteroides sp.]